MAGDPTEPNQTARQKKSFVLCFDGTGNKFSGTDADSNILKLYRMLDRSDTNVFTFYQPGIGTYITSSNMQTTSLSGRIHSWVTKAKDSAVGTNFADHIMGGYKFLMKFYSCEDDLYFFGFSRGAYTARFLAEMLDHVGLLSAGNEELARFAWKTYAKWSSRKNDGSPTARREEKTLYEYIRGFRETFSRPVRRIRFLGLFDTVNSVSRIEHAWLARTKRPYTAKSSAKVIRHAVSIDERRAKFRQDLVDGNEMPINKQESSGLRSYETDLTTMTLADGPDAQQKNVERLSDAQGELTASTTYITTNDKPNAGLLSMSRGPSGGVSRENASDGKKRRQRDYVDLRKKQDIEEVWFAGGHADIGGGWGRSSGER